MSNVKEIGKRIKSIQNTAKITHAMELVAATKMKRAQDGAVSAKPYSQLINDVLQRIIANIDKAKHLLLTPNDTDCDLVIVISPDRGLAGPLTTNLIRQLSQFKNPQTNFIAIGKKAKDFIIKSKRQLLAEFTLPENGPTIFIRPIIKLAIDQFLSKSAGKVFIVYTEFHSTLKQQTQTKQLLPITNLDEYQMLQEPIKPDLEFVFEPPVDQILDALLPHYLLVELAHYLLESRASEQSARMLAMKNATDNALDLVEDLKLAYNQIRQEIITKEILDISTAQIAL